MVNVTEPYEKSVVDHPSPSDPKRPADRCPLFGSEAHMKIMGVYPPTPETREKFVEYCLRAAINGFGD